MGLAWAQGIFVDILFRHSIKTPMIDNGEPDVYPPEDFEPEDESVTVTDPHS